MRKKLLMYVMLAMVALGCIGCAKVDEPDKSSSNKSEIEDIDNPKYDEFVEKVMKKRWYRGTSGCTEYLSFWDNGGYAYYEACGSPVGDHDLYDVWEYDKKNDVILLKGYPGDAEPEYNEDPTRVKYKSSIEYISCDGETLVMFIDGEERTFKLEREVEDYNEDSDGDSKVPDILEVTINTKGGEFMWYIEGSDWIQADGSGNEMSFKWNDQTENSEFTYITSSGEVVEGFELFDIYEYEGEAELDEKMNVILYNSDGEETKTIIYVGYIDEKLVLEIDGKEVTFTRK